jgi:DNA-binding response OmpR family regulator
MEECMDLSPRLASLKTNQVNVLVVDDQPAKLLTYQVVLGDIGATLIEASSACEAFEYLLKKDIALILIDVCMPDLDGFELATLIREHPRFQRIAIIFVSAILHSDLDRLRGYELGAFDYISVPIVPELLRAKVKVFLDLYCKTRQLKRCGAELEQRVLDRTAELHRRGEELERRVEERTRERERALAKLYETRQSETMGYAAEVAHDFNNLSMAVLGNLKLLDKRLPEDSAGRPLLHNAIQGAQRGATVTQSLLAFFRRRERRLAAVDMSTLVRGIAELLKNALGFGIELTCQFPRALPKVLAESNQLELALLTVALDTRDAMPEGGRLAISASAEYRASDCTDPPLPAGSYVRIRMVSTVAQDVGRSQASAELREIQDRASDSALSAMRMMTGEFGGALRIERRVNGETLELWLAEDISSRATHSIGSARLGPFLETREDRPI